MVIKKNDEIRLCLSSRAAKLSFRNQHRPYGGRITVSFTGMFPVKPPQRCSRLRHCRACLSFVSSMWELGLFAWLLASPASPSASFLALANFEKHERRLRPLDTVLYSLPYSSGLRRSEPNAIQIGNIYNILLYNIAAKKIYIYLRKRTNLCPI